MLYRYLKSYGLCCFVFFISSTSYATSSPEQRAEDAANQAFLLEQQRQLEREQQQRPANLFLQPQQQALMPAPVTSEQCFTIQQIDLTGATTLPADQAALITHPYIGQCISLKDMNLIVQLITRWYLQQGYVTTRAYLTPQDIADGQLEISVIEGALSELNLQDLTHRELAMILPQEKGEILNLRHLETALEQLNRLPGYDVSMELLPGMEPSQTLLSLTNKAGRPYRVQLNADNLGSASTGDNQLQTLFSIASPLGLADQLTLSLNGTEEQGANRGTQGLSLQYRIPYVYWNFTGSYQKFEYQQPITTASSEFLSSGRSEILNLKASRIVARGQRYKWSLHGGLTYKDNRSFLDDILLLLSSSKLAVANVRIDYSHQLTGGSVTVAFDINRGTRLLGALKEPFEPDAPEPGFEKYTLSGSYQQQLSTPRPILFNSSLFGQYSPDNLYASEQISVGGYYSVRGLESSRFAGIKGWHWRNELAMPLNDALPQAWGALFDGLEPYIGLDAGWVEDIDGTNERLVGAVAGLRLTGRHVRFDLGTAAGLKGDQPHESPDVYATLAMHF